MLYHKKAKQKQKPLKNTIRMSQSIDVLSNICEFNWANVRFRCVPCSSSNQFHIACCSQYILSWCGLFAHNNRSKVFRWVLSVISYWCFVPFVFFFFNFLLFGPIFHCTYRQIFDIWTEKRYYIALGRCCGFTVSGVGRRFCLFYSLLILLVYFFFVISFNMSIKCLLIDSHLLANGDKETI